jgi:hypothetical protein
LIESNSDEILIFIRNLANDINDVVVELLLFVEADVWNFLGQGGKGNCSVRDV